METEKKIEDNMRSALKQALERRQVERLSSNFSYRMMGHIRLEAEKQRKRKAKISWVALLTSVLALLGLGIYFLFFYVDINLEKSGKVREKRPYTRLRRKEFYV